MSTRVRLSLIGYDDLSDTAELLVRTSKCSDRTLDREFLSYEIMKPGQRFRAAVTNAMMR